MYSKNGTDIISIDTKKFLGKKIKRMDNFMKLINKNPRKPPTISKKTLLQIEKVILERKKQHIKFGANQNIDNKNIISTNTFISRFIKSKRIDSPSKISSFIKKAKFFR